MSRCFPFPPPGYEKKIIATGSDLLKKEKHREKKHKKEKKDREKKDDEAKRDRDRSNGKSRERKDKKEKHRDKKKEKTKDKYQKTDTPSPLGEAINKAPPEESAELIDNKRNLDTHILFDDRRPLGNSAGCKGQNLGRYTSLDCKSNGVRVEQEFERADKDGTKTFGGRTGERITLMHHKRNGGGESFYPNNHLANSFEDSDLALELDRRLKNEAEPPYHQNDSVSKHTAPQKKDIRVIKSAYIDTMERVDDRIKGAIGSYDQAKAAGMTTVPHVSTPAQLNHARMPRPPLAKNIGMKLEVPERINHREDKITDLGKKRKDKDSNGERKNLGTDSRLNKEGKEEKRSNRGDQTTVQSIQGSHKMDAICTPNHQSHSETYNNRNMPKEEKLSQTKERLTNGIYDVTGPSKLSRPSSIHLRNDNGKALELPQNLVQPSPDGQGDTDKIKVDKVGKVNGVIETHLQRPATELAVQVRRPSLHPDAKRFNEVLSVPKIDELSEFDDSDWLFDSSGRAEKKLRTDDCSHACSSADTPHVWSKATNIDSADVYALPYVIPY